MNAPISPAATLGWTWSNVDPAAHFAPTYTQARNKFLAAARARDLEGAWRAGHVLTHSSATVRSNQGHP